MKPLKSVAAVAAALLPQLAQAEVLDLNTVKCKNFLASSKENIGNTLAELDGPCNGDRLGSYCGTPGISVGPAAEELSGR